MTHLPEEHMADIHIIRQDYAQARAEYEADRDDKVAEAHLEEQHQRRARAMRSLHRDDNASVRRLAAMFRCTKSAVREALAEETE
jgi:hypothetical protein